MKLPSWTLFFLDLSVNNKPSLDMVTDFKRLMRNCVKEYMSLTL